jgi:hypothetical protein
MVIGLQEKAVPIPSPPPAGTAEQVEVWNEMDEFTPGVKREDTQHATKLVGKGTCHWSSSPSNQTVTG